jgi:putative colanic acid biosynthesis UDP-glucose lipid carrier transferase
MGNGRGMIRPFQAELDFGVRLADMALVGAALWIATLFHDLPWTNIETFAAMAASVLFYLVAQATGLYVAHRGHPLRDEVTRIVTTWMGVLTLLLLVAFVTKTSAEFSRRLMISWAAAAPMLLGVWRAVLRFALHEARERGYNTRSAAIVGVSTIGVRLAERFEGSPWMGIDFAGFFDDRSIERLGPNAPAEHVDIQGGFDALVAKCRRREVDLVYIALPPRAEPRIHELVRRLADTTVSVYLAYDFGGFDLLRARWSSVGDVPVMGVVENPFHGGDGFAKRIEDIILASFILGLIAVPMMIIAAAVKLTSRGPVFFRQRRYGLNGEEIRVLKFRTMTVCEDGNTVTQAIKGDQRITKLGAILRRTSLDELPQFLNVLSGEMSIVGPRPHAVAHNEQYRSLIQGYMRRHKVKPGITGWAQVNGWRGETDTLEKMEKRVQYDLEYINGWNLGLDLKIILMTAWTVLRPSKNAY